MNLIEQVVGKVSEALGIEVAPPVPVVPGLGAALSAARANVETKAKALGELALAVEENQPGALQRYEGASRDHEAALKRLRDLERAEGASRARESAKLAAEEEEARRKREAEVAAALSELHAVGPAMDANLAELEALTERADKAINRLHFVAPGRYSDLGQARAYFPWCIAWRIRKMGGKVEPFWSDERSLWSQYLPQAKDVHK